MEAVMAGFIGLVGSFLLIYVLDRVWQTPVWARVVILLGGVSLSAVFAPYWLHRWVWGHRREGQLARLIAKRYPGLGDRLLGVIELEGQHEDGGSLSPGLRAAAMEMVAAEAEKRDLGSALPSGRHRRWAFAAAGLAGLAVSAFVLSPRAGLNAFQRWLMPLSEVERYTFTQLDKMPDVLAVPYGEAFEIGISLAKDTARMPGEGLARLGLQKEVKAGLRKRGYLFKFPGQQEDGTMVFQIGDVRRETRIEPKQRPGVVTTKATVGYPEYLQLPGREVDLTGGELSLVNGSELRLELGMSRALRSGRYFTEAKGGDPANSNAGDGEGGGGRALEISGKTARTGVIGMGKSALDLNFEWVDKFGLEGGGNFKLKMGSLEDAAPLAYTQNLERQKAILPEEVLDFDITTEDDFGLKNAGIEWETIGTPGGGAIPSKGEIVLAEGGPEARRLMSAAAFSPAAFGLGPQKLSLRAFGEDYFPGRGRTYSEPVVIYVMSREEHAQLLKSQFDRTISELEDLSRKELNLLDENERLERLEDGALQTGENRKRIDAQERDESENARRMDELAKKMEEVMKGAARNGEFDKETMKKMAEAMKSMQELAEEDLPEVRDKLRDARDQANAPEKTKGDISEAVEKQKLAVEKIKQAVEQANDANKRFEASTFVSRLKKAAGEQNGIATTLVGAFSEILGVRKEEVDPRELRKLEDTGKQQMLTASDVRWLQEDLGHYHARTGEAPFKDILDKMKESNIDIGLEDVRTKVRKNHSFTAAESAIGWGEKLSGWAKLLGEEMDKNGGGGGGGGGAPSAEDEDFEFMLRVMKMIQQEQDLRSRTRVLEQLKRDGGASAALR